MSPTRPFALALALLTAGSGCAVPDVVFVVDGAAADAAREALAPDALPPADGPVEGAPGCPGTIPPGATTCCGVVPCQGCAQADCPRCLSQCSVIDVCCIHGQGVSCHPAGTCP